MIYLLCYINTYLITLFLFRSIQSTFTDYFCTFLQIWLIISAFKFRLILLKFKCVWSIPS